MLITSTANSPVRRVALLLALGAAVGVVVLSASATADNALWGSGGDVIAADDGGSAKDGESIPGDSYPGKEEGFERGVNKEGAEVYRYEQNNQVYVVPANDYYAWRNEYYYEGYHGGLTHAMLTALLMSHMYSAMAYPRATFYSSYAWHPATTAYYSSPAYTSHFGAPQVVGGQVVHSGTTGVAAAHATPVARGTPVARATPVAQGTPVAKGTPVAQPKPAAAARPTVSRGWSTARTRYRSSSFRGFCFVAHAAVRLPDGSSAPISTLKPGDLVAGWPNAAAVIAGKPASSMRIASVQRMETGGRAPLRGLALSLPHGRTLSLPPFVTTNHPLLAADGSWTAIDPALAASELASYVPNATVWGAASTAYRPPAIEPLAAGVRMLVAPPQTDGASKPVAASVDQVVEDAKYTGAVFSLELDVADLGVYLVNSMLVMD